MNNAASISTIRNQILSTGGHIHSQEAIFSGLYTIDVWERCEGGFRPHYKIDIHHTAQEVDEIIVHERDGRSYRGQ